MTGTKTDFTGSFVEYAIVNFDFDAPEDVDNMQDIRDLAAKYGKNRVWGSFLELYECIPQKQGVGITREMTKRLSKSLLNTPANLICALRWTAFCVR